MTKAEPPVAAFLESYFAGARAADVAAQFGVSTRRIYREASRHPARQAQRALLRRAKALRADGKTAYGAMRVYGPVGYMREVLAALSEDERAWLAQQVPAGGNVAQALALIVRDAYAEDQNGG